MKSRHLNIWVFLILLALSIYYFFSITSVPFHPDESTQIFMSSDLSSIFEHPSTLFWDTQKENDIKQIYRLRDSPLTRYLIGFGRLMAKKSPLIADWNWSASWEENQNSGALPDRSLLLVSRLSVALFYPLLLWITYQTGKHLNGVETGLLAMVFMGCNALILLHTRRAMAESVMMFTIVMFVWALAKHKEKPSLLGILAGLAFCAKQSTFPLLIVGFLSMVKLRNASVKTNYLTLSRTGIYILSFIAVVYLLNPVIWRNPISATTAAIKSRRELVSNQTQEMQAKMAGQVVKGLGQRSAAVIIQLFIAPPMPADVGNYLDQTKEMDQMYVNNPLNHLFRGVVGGGIMMIFFLFGLLFSLKTRLTHLTDWDFNLALGLLWFLQTAAIVIFVPIAWQRYYLPILPYIIFFQAFALTHLYKKTKTALSSSTRR